MDFLLIHKDRLKLEAMMAFALNQGLEEFVLEIDDYDDYFFEDKAQKLGLNIQIRLKRGESISDLEKQIEKLSQINLNHFAKFRNTILQNLGMLGGVDSEAKLLKEPEEIIDGLIVSFEFNGNDLETIKNYLIMMFYNKPGREKFKKLKRERG
jgi:hypothetical protein